MGSWRIREVWLPIAAITALAASSALAVRGAYRARAVEERTLRDFATLAGWNYSFRVYSMLANSAPGVVNAAGRRGDRPPRADLAALAAHAEALRRCCAVALPSRGVASGAWSDPASVLLLPAVPVSDAEREARLIILREVTRWGSLDGDPVRLVPGGSPLGPFLLVVYPQYGAPSSGAGFVAIDLDLDAAVDSMFGAMFNQPPVLLPQSMVGVSTNGALARVDVIDGTGRRFFRSSADAVSAYGATVGLGRREELALTLSLTDAGARGLLRGQLPGRGAGMQLALASLALALALAIAIAFSRAQRLARVRAEFAASVTHELRTPLTQILLNAETLHLGRERSPAERAAFVSAIVEESRRLVRLIDNVLHLSKAERRDLHLDLDPVRLDVPVAAAMRERGLTGEAAGPGHAIWANADADALRLVVSNLIDNALRYGEGTAVRVSMGESGGRAVLLVEDGGPGIARADRRRVLEPYVRLEGARALHRSGTGIGLAIVAELVRAMEGTLAFEDAAPVGLRVRITLAAAAPPRPA